jgi:hypothetical protein
MCRVAQSRLRAAFFVPGSVIICALAVIGDIEALALGVARMAQRNH